uniref:Uncharacterized protein n=1 Tax=Arundo donax TaxID=35708 RepID=A0A0A9CHZ7_ARUDO
MLDVLSISGIRCCLFRGSGATPNQCSLSAQ